MDVIARSRQIVKTSLVGIGVNIIMVALKMTIGALTGSIAIILDAVNNCSDALSSVITIAGTKLAGRAPDKKHPYGYGRIEYMSAVIISFIILIAGGSSVKESIETIVSGEKAEYDAISIIILAAAVVIKFFAGRYVRGVGKKIQARTLIASGTEALFDCILSLGTIIAAFIGMATGIALEGWLGVIIAVVIIKNGGEMLVDTLSVLIGKRTDRDLTVEVRNFVNSYPEVLGTYDVIMHNYGPSQHMGSVHVELNEEMDARQVHLLTRRIRADIYEKMGIILTLGVYSSCDREPEAKKLRDEVLAICHDTPGVVQMHGFFLEDTMVGFDIVVDFKYNALEIREEIRNALKKTHPRMEFYILIDQDFSD